MLIGVENIEQSCLICGKLCKNRRSLGNHVARSHKNLAGLEEYVLKYQLNNVVPKCKCGCEKNVTWHKLSYRYNLYLAGHNKSGFEVSQPKFSKQQIENRNNSIRKTYNLHGDEIKKKISTQVKAKFSSKEGKEILSKSRKK